MYKWYTKILQITALVLAVTITTTGRPVQAHEIEILRSDPADGVVVAAAPAVVQAWFGSELAAEGSSLQVFDAAGTQVDLKDGGLDTTDASHTSLKVGLPAGLPDGLYVARWKAFLPDGDSVLGTFQFTVAAAPYPAAAGLNAPAQAELAYPAGGFGSEPGPASAFINKLFSDRSSPIGAGIGGLAILLGLLILVRRLKSGRD